MCKGGTPFDRLSNKFSKIAGFITSVTVIVGALMGVGAWASNQFANAVAGQVQEFRDEVKAANDRQEQAITRVELSILMEHDPENVAAIEKMARYYFQELQGDLYMTSKYSDWAKTYGGDISIIVGVH